MNIDNSNGIYSISVSQRTEICNFYELTFLLRFVSICVCVCVCVCVNVKVIVFLTVSHFLQLCILQTVH